MTVRALFFVVLGSIELHVSCQHNILLSLAAILFTSQNYEVVLWFGSAALSYEATCFILSYTGDSSAVDTG